MASEVDICNLALAHLGDSATVASIDPPEGSAQAEHCARFYPIARDALLEMHAWGFATKRVLLAQLVNDQTSWEYCYQQPSDVIGILGIIDSTTPDDYSASGSYVPQPYVSEINSAGQQVIYTDLANAVMRYTATVSDTTKFSPLFVTALSWYLASLLAGPILKGDAGAAEAKRCLNIAQGMLSKAEDSDANQRKTGVTHNVAWIRGR